MNEDHEMIAQELDEARFCLLLMQTNQAQARNRHDMAIVRAYDARITDQTAMIARIERRLADALQSFYLRKYNI